MRVSVGEGPLDRYEILGRLGKGGMAEVFRARVRSGPRKGWIVAVKRLLPELAEQAEYVDLFTREAALALALEHPNVVRTLEVVDDGATSFIVMEYVDGRDLGQVLRQCRQRGLPLPVDFGVFLTRMLLEALAYAHAARSENGQPLSVVHCDVAPSNLFISRTGEVKLGDFGVARGLLGPQGQTAVTGKPYYLSPEVLRGEISPVVDLWAAGVVLYETLTLQRPFLGSNPDEVFAAVRARAYQPVRALRPELSPALAAIVDRGFRASAEDRFATAAEFATTLASHYDERVGTPLAIAALVRGLFGSED